MNPLGAIVMIAIGLGGVACAISALPVLRRPRLASRLDEYLGALGPRRSPLLAPQVAVRGAIGTAFRPLLDRLGTRLQHLLGEDGRGLETRLAAADLEVSPADFRARQVTWGLAGFAAALTGALMLVAAGRSLSGPAVLIAAVTFAAGGVMMCDRRLTRAVDRRRERIVAEFATFVDLVCLAVTAGESLRGALELVAGGSGALATEVRASLQEARAGRPIAEALETRARRLAVAPLERFVEAVVIAQERGMPLADSLRAMAFDVRESEKRSVIEAGGRKQISMLMPVVGLILPVAIVFAFYPGLVAIRTLAR